MTVHWTTVKRDRKAEKRPKREETNDQTEHQPTKLSKTN